MKFRIYHALKIQLCQLYVTFHLIKSPYDVQISVNIKTLRNK